MGQCVSAPEDGYLRSIQPQFDALRLRPSEVRKLHAIFLQVDQARCGSIGLRELMNHLEMGGTVFKDRVFSIFDEDGSGKVDFREFALSLWNYCTLSRTTLDLFAFDLYDTDSNGELSSKEIHGLLHDLYGSDLHSHPAAKAVLSELTTLCEKQTVDISLFQHFVHSHPSLLFPAFQLQHALRRKILGEGFWERASERRIRLSEGRFLPVSELLDLNASSALLDLNGVVDKEARLLLSSTGTLHTRQVRASSHPSTPASPASPVSLSHVYPFDLDDASEKTVDLTAGQVEKMASGRRDKVFAKLQSVNEHQGHRESSPAKTPESSFIYPLHPMASMHSHVLDQHAHHRHTVKPSRTPFADKPQPERERRHTLNQSPHQSPLNKRKRASNVGLKLHDSFANKGSATALAQNSMTAGLRERRLTLH